MSHRIGCQKQSYKRVSRSSATVRTNAPLKEAYYADSLSPSHPIGMVAILSLESPC